MSKVYHFRLQSSTSHGLSATVYHLTHICAFRNLSSSPQKHTNESGNQCHGTNSTNIFPFSKVRGRVRHSQSMKIGYLTIVCLWWTSVIFLRCGDTWYDAWMILGTNPQKSKFQSTLPYFPYNFCRNSVHTCRELHVSHIITRFPFLSFFLFCAQGFRVGRTNEIIKQASQNLQYCLVLWVRTRTIERCRWELQRSKIPCFFQQKFRLRPTLVQDLGMSQQHPTSSDISCSLGYKIG